jgi:hypothetical protein
LSFIRALVENWEQPLIMLSPPVLFFFLKIKNTAAHAFQLRMFVELVFKCLQPSLFSFFSNSYQSLCLKLFLFLLLRSFLSSFWIYFFGFFFLRGCNGSSWLASFRFGIYSLNLFISFFFLFFQSLVKFLVANSNTRLTFTKVVFSEKFLHPLVS